MKTLLCFLLLSLTLNAIQAQNQNTSFELHLAPAFSTFLLEPHERNLGTVGDLSVELGGYFFFPLSKSWQFNVGLNYHLIQLTEIDRSLNFPCDFNPTTFEFNPDGSFIEIKHDITYLSLPLLIQRKLNHRDNYLYANLGLLPMIRIAEVQNKLLVECGQPSSHEGNAAGQNPADIQVHLRFGLGMAIQIGAYNHLRLEPFATYALNTFQTTSDFSTVNKIKARVWQLGLSLGIKFSN